MYRACYVCERPATHRIYLSQADNNYLSVCERHVDTAKVQYGQQVKVTTIGESLITR